ncbi:hypothetical protein LTR92_002625 [Exophiala xenobiotica]|nr:hypothetical protein LTR92_002625 [Exophiala xenobiotica]
MSQERYEQSELQVDSEAGDHGQQQRLVFWPRWLNRHKNDTNGRYSSFSMRRYPSRFRIIVIGLALWSIAVLFHLFRGQSGYSIPALLGSTNNSTSSTSTHHVSASRPSPFTGALARIPRISELPSRQRRLTVIGAWNDDYIPNYMPHFLYTIQLNADVVDFVLINRQRKGDRCLDFEKAGIDVTWGGNIQMHCMTDSEWKRRHVDFLCSSKHGWNCNSTEYDEVTQEFQSRPDKSNYNWRPLRGHIFQDLLPHPENPFWAWMDLDTFAGDFRRYPFNLLSQVSILTSNTEAPSTIYLGGQLTAFNFDDDDLASAWKKFPEMETPFHFTRNITGYMPESTEERYWSYGYLNPVEGLPGNQISYGFYTGLHGDDFLDGEWKKQNASEAYVISGRDILLVPTHYTRLEIEELLNMERSEPFDDLGGLGWTEDEEEDTSTSTSSSPAYRGLVEDLVIRVGDCPHTHVPENLRLCVTPHPLELTNPPLLRSTFIRQKGQKPGHILRRLERDPRPRGYERKLLKHHLFSKHQMFYQFPPMEITPDLVLKMQYDSLEVFRMGETRNETLFMRKETERIG